VTAAAFGGRDAELLRALHDQHARRISLLMRTPAGLQTIAAASEGICTRSNADTANDGDANAVVTRRSPPSKPRLRHVLARSRPATPERSSTTTRPSTRTTRPTRCACRSSRRTTSPVRKTPAATSSTDTGPLAHEPPPDSSDRIYNRCSS
jgi:hypothetical protein